MSTAGRSGDQSVVSSARVEDERTELLRRKISLWPYVKYRRVFIKDTAESIVQMKRVIRTLRSLEHSHDRYKHKSCEGSSAQLRMLDSGKPQEVFAQVVSSAPYKQEVIRNMRRSR
jgi:hypothetical protein